MANWREAAELYRQAQAVVEKDKQDEKIARVARQLQEFLDSQPGRDACELLDASNQAVYFAREVYPDGPKAKVVVNYYLYWRGLMLCRSRDLEDPDDSEMEGVWAATITALDAVRAAAKFGNRDPDKLLDWLRAELDKIAAAAPHP